MISLAGSLTRTKPVESTTPKRVQITTIRLRLGADRSKGTDTGSITVNTGVSLFT